MKPLCNCLTLSALTCLLAALPAYAQLTNYFTVDEWGHSSYTPGVLMPDPTGGLSNWNVLVYSLPFAGVRGDVLMYDPLEGGGVFDVLRFDGNFHLVFYSDDIGGFDAPADTPSPPRPLYTNQVRIAEQGLEGGVQFGLYTPLASQPGWDVSMPSYKFISDVPEPAAPALLAGCLGLFWANGVRRKRSL